MRKDKEWSNPHFYLIALASTLSGLMAEIDECAMSQTAAFISP
ncbi:MAG: hypothetical protein P1U34_02540 [Coxiellaceae bacterium]|nr:hypothetical protein [Coxiellaceae bacterium]